MPDNNGKSPGLDKKEPREILDLNAREVSLVDRPAIVRTFLVVKRQEDTMGAFENETNKSAEGSIAVPVEKTAEKTEPVASAQATATETSEAEKAKAKKAEKCPKCGAILDEEGACLNPKCDYQAKGCGGGAKKPDMTKKSLVSFDTETAEITIEGEVSKGLKGFTENRMKSLGNAVGALLKLMAEVNPEVTKSMISDLVKQALPGDLKWTSGTTAVPASAVAKSEATPTATTEQLSAIVKSVLEPVVKRVEEIGGQVAEITKTRISPQSESIGTDKVEKSQGSFWGGLPLK